MSNILDNLDNRTLFNLAQIDKLVPNWEDGIEDYFVSQIKMNRCSPIDKSKDYVYWNQKIPATHETQVAYFGFNVASIIEEYKILALANRADTRKIV